MVATVAANALRRLEISFSKGAEWKALISKYIGTIPLSGDASSAAEQSISGGPPPRAPVSSAILQKSARREHGQSLRQGRPHCRFRHPQFHAG
jgi:hypothetical protein